MQICASAEKKMAYKWIRVSAHLRLHFFYIDTLVSSLNELFQNNIIYDHFSFYGRSRMEISALTIAKFIIMIWSICQPPKMFHFIFFFLLIFSVVQHSSMWVCVCVNHDQNGAASICWPFEIANCHINMNRRNAGTKKRHNNRDSQSFMFLLSPFGWHLAILSPSFMNKQEMFVYVLIKYGWSSSYTSHSSAEGYGLLQFNVSIHGASQKANKQKSKLWIISPVKHTHIAHRLCKKILTHLFV